MGNHDGGLQVQSNGAITANAIVAVSNQNQYGALFDNHNATTSPGVTLTGTNNFKYNGADGLDVTSKGGITINNVTATSNGQLVGTYYGASLNNTYVALATPSVKVTGTNNYFYDNPDDGLIIASTGPVSLSNIIANNNRNNGVYIRNDTAPKLESVMLTGTNTFNDNDTAGLDISSKGFISLSNVPTSNNTIGQGVLLSNVASTTSTPQAVTVGGSNLFAANGLTGLKVTSYGN